MPSDPIPSLPTIAELSAQPQPSAGPSWGSVIEATQNTPPAPVHDRLTDTDFPTESPTESLSSNSFAGETVFAEAAAVVEAPVAPPPAPEPEVAKVLEPAAVAPATSSSNSWYSVASSPWEAEAQKAGKLAATWDTDFGKSAPPPPPAPVEEVKESAPVMAIPEVPSPVEVEPEIPAVSAYSGAETQLTSSAQEAIREETEQVVEQAIHEAAPVASSNSAPAVEPNLDDVVAKVLAKMSPEVLQAVTREILKPVVEAMVRDEINKK
jgi:hypothetical protein